MACELKGKTGNPICSDDLADLRDNAIIMDQYINSAEFVVSDRLGVERKTWAGIEKDAQDNIDGFEGLINDKIIAQGGVQVLNEWVRLNDAPPSTEFLMDNLGYVTPEMFGAVGDGISDDSIPLINATNKGVPVYLTSVYFLTSSLPNVHSIDLIGSGSILSNGNTFHANPVLLQENVIYVSADGDVSNDGLSPETATTPSSALLKYIQNYAVKANSGTWRVQFLAGNYTNNGLRLNNLPSFKNKFQVYGEVDSEGNPAVIWDGSAATERNCLRSDQTSNTLNIHFKDIEFKNWKDSALVFWGNINILQENVNLDGSGTFGFWYRSGYVRVLGGTVKNSGSSAFCFQYNCSFNVGNANDPVTFDSCRSGVYIGRVSAGHVANNVFRNIERECITATMNCRVRTRGNTFESWGLAGGISPIPAVLMDDSSVWSNGNSEIDYFTNVTGKTPAFLVNRGSVASNINSSGRTPHSFFNTFFTIPAGSGRTFLDSAKGYGSPLRLRGVSLFSETFVGEIEFAFILNANQGGKVDLATGAGNASIICSTDINNPSTTESTGGIIRIVLFGNQKNSSISRWYIETKYDNGRFAIKRGTISTNDPLFRDNTMNEILTRLYVTPSKDSLSSPTITHMRSYMEV